MYEQIKEPKKQLSKDAVKVWLISETISNIIGFVILGVLLYLDYRFSWKEWIGWIIIGITIFSILSTVWSFINPFLLYKSWRYDVDEEFLHLKSGVLKEEYRLIPMTKIQSVSTTQGPLLRKYGLSSVVIETMASSYPIPALPINVAVGLRKQIAEYAKIKEVEE